MATTIIMTIMMMTTAAIPPPMAPPMTARQTENDNGIVIHCINVLNN